MSTFIRLTDYKSSDAKEEGFFKSENRYEAKQKNFEKIPASPIAYWVSDRVRYIFESIEKLETISLPRQGMATTDNDRFLRNWQEINIGKIKFDCKNGEEAFNHLWFPFNKGGSTRKWYGNNEYVIYYKENGKELLDLVTKKYPKISDPEFVIKNRNLYFQKGVTWSAITSGIFTVRLQEEGVIFSNAGMSLFPEESMIGYINSCLNSKTTQLLLNAISQTLNYNAGDIAKLPIIFPENDETKQLIETITQQNIDISKEEWDSRETSWDFTKNELLKHKSGSKIQTAYENYCNYWRKKFNTLHANEEELNRLFIDIYELQDELSWHVELKDITILKQESDIVDDKLVFDADEIMKQFVSYGVGVMFGRYSLDKEGLWIANMGQDVEILNQVQNDGIVSFEIDDDNIIPVLEDDYFKDDMTSRFIQFVKVTFGEQNLRENIRFIENSLGVPLRKYFVKGFYEDHLKRYKKRPIYWMVASPKKGFMSLIYMHRYQSDIFARVRNSYLTEYIAKLEAHKETLHLTTTSDTASDKDKKDADKQIKNCDAKLKELIAFDREKMMSFSQNSTDIDLDDGVKVNYCKFEDILYPISGLCK